MPLDLPGQVQIGFQSVPGGPLAHPCGATVQGQGRIMTAVWGGITIRQQVAAQILAGFGQGGWRAGLEAEDELVAAAVRLADKLLAATSASV